MKELGFDAAAISSTAAVVGVVSGELFGVTASDRPGELCHHLGLSKLAIAASAIVGKDVGMNGPINY